VHKLLRQREGTTGHQKPMSEHLLFGPFRGLATRFSGYHGGRELWRVIYRKRLMYVTVITPWAEVARGFIGKPRLKLAWSYDFNASDRTVHKEKS
jgi:hypothetical protein